MADKFSQYNQIELKGIYLWRNTIDNQPPPIGEAVDITLIVSELNIYEDIMTSSISASLLLADHFNLADTFPIVGGERISIAYKTPLFDNVIQKVFVVYKIGNKQIDVNAQQKGAVYSLYLCTEDKWLDANLDVSQAFTGTYGIIATDVIVNTLQSKTPFVIEDSFGEVTVISPFWSPLKIVDYCASRAFNESLSPYFFFETLQGGYRFLPYSNLLAQEPIKTLYIEPKRFMGKVEDAERTLNTINRIETYPTNDKLAQYAQSLYGANVFSINLKDKTIQYNTQDYQTNFSANQLHIEEYPLSDGMQSVRNKTKFSVVKYDDSHLAAYTRNQVLGMLENYRVSVECMGDTRLGVGMLVNMDIPANVIGGINKTEQVTSGKWLISSIRHIITRERYKVNLGLVKDSHQTDLGVLANANPISE